MRARSSSSPQLRPSPRALISPSEPSFSKEDAYDGQPVESLLRGARCETRWGEPGAPAASLKAGSSSLGTAGNTPDDFEALQIGDDDLRVESRLRLRRHTTALAQLQKRECASGSMFAAERRAWCADSSPSSRRRSEEITSAAPLEARIAGALGATLSFRTQRRRISASCPSATHRRAPRRRRP